MSASFRPVKTQWGSHSSQFVDRGTLLEVLHAVANEINSETQTSDLEEMTELWIMHGEKFLQFLVSKQFTVARSIELLNKSRYEPDKEDLESLVVNMKALAKTWKESLEADGGLRFYLD